MPQEGFGLVEMLIISIVIVLLMFGGLYTNKIRKQQSTLQAGADAIQKAQEIKDSIEKQNILNNF